MRKNADSAIDKAAITQLVGQVHAVAEQYHCHSGRVQRLSYDINSDIAASVIVADSNKCPMQLQQLQGLSLAQHRPFGEVILKWELCRAKQTDSNPQNHESQVVDSSSLIHEGNLLQQLAGRGCSPALLQAIEEEVVFLEHNWHLTILVLPYYPLGSLKNYIKNNKLTQPQKIAVVLAVAQAVLALHQAGWSHGDIKPSNLLIKADQLIMAEPPDLQLLLNDFALAEPIPALLPTLPSPSSTLTYPKGTPAYLAPECWQGQGSSVQSDIYAFGVMMFEVLTGEKPYQIERGASDSQDKLLHQWAVVHCQQPIPRLPIEYQEYQPILDSMLAKRKAQRLTEIVEFIRLME